MAAPLLPEIVDNSWFCVLHLSTLLLGTLGIYTSDHLLGKLTVLVARESLLASVLVGFLSKMGRYLNSFYTLLGFVCCECLIAAWFTSFFDGVLYFIIWFSGNVFMRDLIEFWYKNKLLQQVLGCFCDEFIKLSQSWQTSFCHTVSVFSFS